MQTSYPSEEEIYEDRTIRAQQTVEAYTKNHLFPDSRYKSYRFYDLRKMKHPEIKKLERLFQKKKKLEDLRKADKDSLKRVNKKIDQQKDSIKANNWGSIYKMENMFSITTSSQEKSIYEFRFFLNFKLDSVIKVESVMRAEEPKAIRGVFYHFYSERSLSNNTEKDEAFYNFYKNKLASFDDPSIRGDFMEHCMEITAVAASKNSVKLDQLSKGMIESYKKQDEIIKEANIIKYGKFYETVDSSKDTDQVLKYDRNVLFSILNDSTGGNDSLGMKFVFDPYLRVDKVYTIPPPYDKIF